ncbi:hypothetical protein Mal15_13830 [Stieleria maiorica]|uniref:Uncharacterized protein n=1 Tax=Stieleria maiorica TaxID=2795974 RepID=A0A5B9M9I9_9BACT|nr:hypothetical protein [Stieleria maiorica]QEF97343.1 hypothetical protein Mal15_13830 [Stieleria maiorica]
MPTPRPNRIPGTPGQNCCRKPCRRRFYLAISLILTCAILPVGCASWSSWPGHEDSPHSDRGGPTLPLKKITRTIELETRFVQIRFDPADPDQLQSMWQWVDETVLSPETRTVLRHNGLRIGKAAQPERLVGKLDALQSAQSPDIVADFLSSVAVSSHQSEGTKTIPMRLGKRYELPVRLPIQGDQVVIIHDHPQPIGRTLRDPQFLLAVTPRPDRVASQIRLRVRPEIQHGDMQQDWVQGDAALRIDVRRQSWSLDSMEFELAGGEGDLFVVSETTERKGLGREMFGGKNVDQMEQQTVLLIRIANVPTPAEKL